MSNQRNVAERIHQAMTGIIAGNESAVQTILTALFAGGHVLIEGVPGTAKTLSARLLANLISAETRRIQFTPDVMPSDILGTNVFDPRTTEFSLRKGPIFTNIVIADEINRTSPKTQSALLEAMEESTVSIDGEIEHLPPLFFVCATQNPIDFEGTYPLPEAQLDRFLVRAQTNYPRSDQERTLLARVAHGFDGNNLAAAGVERISSIDEILDARQSVRAVTCTSPLQGYLYDIVAATRSAAEFTLGASPRALIALLRATQATAFLNGRDFATPDDAKSIASSVLAHRVILRPEAELDGVKSETVIERIIASIEVPRLPTAV